MTHAYGSLKAPRDQAWTTPRALFEQLRAEFAFTLDAAAAAGNALCPDFLDEERDALVHDWPGVVFCNPPFKRCGAFVAKAEIEAAKGSTVVMLVPSRTDVAWWHEIAMPCAEIRFLRGRVRFGGQNVNAPFACCVLVFRPPASRS